MPGRLRRCTGRQRAKPRCPHKPCRIASPAHFCRLKTHKKGIKKTTPEFQESSLCADQQVDLLCLTGSGQRNSLDQRVFLPTSLPITAPAAAPPTVPSVLPNTASPTTPPTTAPVAVPICALVGRPDAQPVSVIKAAAATDIKIFVFIGLPFLEIQADSSGIFTS
jgi:hypothetical protein